MAFPAVEAANYASNGTTTTHNIGDFGTAVAGELLAAFCFNYPFGNISSFPGWTKVDGSGTTELWCKIAAGGEQNVTYTTDVGCKSVNFAMRISGWHGASWPAFAVATGSDANPNPPNLTPPWSSQDTLWIAWNTVLYGSAPTTAYPTNYSGNQMTTTSSGLYGVSAGIASRNLAAGSENPDPFTISVGFDWTAGTIAVRPVSGVRFLMVD